VKELETMKTIAVTGPRDLTVAQIAQVRADFMRALQGVDKVHVGDATGVDEVCLGRCQYFQRNHQIYFKNESLPWAAQGAERSARMAKAARKDGATLHAWPNKPCPEGLKPAKGWPRGAAGSGTWGTIALAVGLGMPVILHPLADLGILPDWLSGATLQEGGQLAIF
jgi:hypothetical protein